MGIELILQCQVLIAAVLRLQGTVLHHHCLMRPDQVVDVAGTIHDQDDDQVADGVQVEMNAGMDGGNVPLMMQEDEQLAQQLTEQPGHAERESQGPPTHPNSRIVETEETQVDEEQ